MSRPVPRGRRRSRCRDESLPGRPPAIRPSRRGASRRSRRARSAPRARRGARSARRGASGLPARPVRPRDSRQPPDAPGRYPGRAGARRIPGRRAVVAGAAPGGFGAPAAATRADQPGEALAAHLVAAELLARRGPWPGLRLVDAALVLPALLGRDRVAAQHRVHRLGDVCVDHDPLAVLDLHDDVEGRRRLTLQDALLRSPPARLVVPEGHALDPADQVRERRVEHQVVEVVAVRGPDELDPALGDRAGGLGLQLGPDLVDDDDLGHVVLDRLDHHLVLEGGRADLHAPCLTDGRVRDVAIAGNLVRRVDHHDALAQVVGEDPGGFPEHRRLADPGATHDEDRLPGLHEVVDDVDRAVDGPPDAAREADDLPGPVPDRADPVERPLDAGPVVVAERADLVDHVGDVRLVDLAVEQGHLAVREAGLRPAAEVHHDLDEVAPLRQGMDRRDDLGRQGGEEDVEVVDQFAGAPVGHGRSPQRTAGTMAGSATRTSVSFIRSVTVAIVLNPSSSSRCSSGDS